MSRPPLELTAEARTPYGVSRRWAGHLPAEDRPQGVTFSTARYDGFKTAGCVLPRRIDQDYHDLHLLDEFALIGADGSVAFEGRMSALPRSLSTEHAINVQAVGWMAHTKDRKFQEIYIDRDLRRWGTPSVQRAINRYGDNFRPPDGGTVQPDEGTGQPALATEIQAPWGATTKALSEPIYRSNDIPLGSLYYAWKRHTNVPAGPDGFTWVAVLGSDDTLASFDFAGDLQAAGPGTGTLTATTAGRYVAAVQLYFDGASVATDTQKYAVYWTVLAVYGRHGLTKRGNNSATEAQGFYVSDVIKDITSRFCPKLNTAGVKDTSYVIPHLEFIDPIYPYDAFLRCNTLHLWGLEVWENRTLHYGPTDLTDYDWQVRLTDPGVSIDLQGDSTDDLANGIIVTYQDLNKGQQQRLTPDEHSELRDLAVENPANRAGYPIWTEITVSFPTTRDAAIEMGRIALAEHNAPRAPGTIRVTGHIRDRGGHWHPAWRPRAGETIAIVDYPNDRPRLITETSYNHDSHSLSVSVEGPPKRLDAYMDRVNTTLAAANLT